MAYKGYRKPFVFRGSDSETSLQYVGSVDTTTTGTTDSDDNTLATVGGFGVTHAVTSRKASPNTVATSDSDGNKGTVKSLEILEALPGWYMKGDSTKGTTSIADSDGEGVFGTDLGTSTDVQVENGIYTLSFSTRDSDCGIGDYVVAAQGGGVYYEGYVTGKTDGNNDIQIRPVSGNWAGFDGTAAWKYTTSNKQHKGQDIEFAGTVVDAPAAKFKI